MTRPLQDLAPRASYRRGAIKKLAGYADEGTRWLMLLSKAALADICTELVRLHCGHADDEITADEAQQAAEPTLRARGDRIPPLPAPRWVCACGLSCRATTSTCPRCGAKQGGGDE